MRGTIPAESVHAISQRLPELTGGEGTFLSDFDHYQLMNGPPPMRAVSGANPYNRKQYMSHVLRRLS